ncbi:MAG TPA: YfhO family protein [Verrucomicrobiae bacterium]
MNENVRSLEHKTAQKTTSPVAAEWLSPRVFLLLLSVSVFAAFPKVVLGLDTFFYRDFGAICYPQAFYQRESLLGGELPFWNPYNYCGTPFMAQWGTWYPVSFLHTLFPMPWSVNLFHLLHLVWAGCGMFWLVRRWGAGAYAAAFAGFAYVFNGVTLSCLMWPGYIAFLAWSPWVLGCTMTAWRQGGRWLVLAGITSAMQVLACAPELLVLFWVFLGLLWLGEVFSGGIPVWASARRLAMVVLLAAGITMVQMLPFFDLLLHSQRDRNFGNDQWVMPKWGLANLLVPLFHCYQSLQGPWFQSGQELVGSYYLGAAVMVLAIVGVLLKRNRASAVLGAMALFCWLMALGSHGILFDWFRRVVPWIGVMRYPVKFALFPVFLLPLMAAWAVDQPAADDDRRRVRMLIIFTSVMLLLMGGVVWLARRNPLPNDEWVPTAQNTAWRAAFALALLSGLLWLPRFRSRAPRIAVQLCVLGCLPVDALTHSPKIIPHLPVANVAPGIWTAGVKALPPKLGEGRVMASPEVDRFLRFSGVRDMALDYTGRRLAQRHSMNLLDSVPKVAGGGMILHPVHFDRLEKHLYSTPNLRVGQGLLDFLSVRWFSSSQNPLLWTARSNYFPVITAGQRPAFASDDQVLRSITADAFDPRAVVYLPEMARSLVRITNSTNCKVLNPRFTAQKIEAEVVTAEPSLIVLSQSFYHLWHASVDGSPTPVLRANLAFQALQVPPGKHRVTLRYIDPYFRIGGVISIIALAGCGLIWACALPGGSKLMVPRSSSGALKE